MTTYSRALRNSPLARGIGGLLAALVCAAALSGCEGDKTYLNPPATKGSLNVNVTPASAAVVVTGPASFTQSFTGNQLLADLTPGQYTANATAAGFVAASSSINVVAGETSSISLDLFVFPPTVGSLNVNVNPASATVVVTGPAGFTPVTFTGNQFLFNLPPGQYTVKATAPGFDDQVFTINVVAGQTSSMSFVLPPTPIIVEAPRAVYVVYGPNNQQNLVPLDPAALQAGRFVFYAWLRDLPSGILPAELTPNFLADPGRPLALEQLESAPSFTQNLAVAWVGFADAQGVVHPVIGADVRWEIDQLWSVQIVNNPFRGSMQFGTSDDNRIALGYGVFDDQADTRTNNARLANERFPLIATEFPLFNQSGIGTPLVDGLTWVTLFSPDAKASARIVAVATINGEEIGKQILYKSFAPAPKIEITKTVSSDVVNIPSGGTATVTWTVTVKNVGFGDATRVDLKDFLKSLPTGATYTPGTLPAGAIPDGEGGFAYFFPLASEDTPPPPQPAQLLGVAQTFAVLANATVTNTGSSVVNGNVGVSAGTAVTGFPPGIVNNGAIHNNDAVATAAQTALTKAYVDLAARPCKGANDTQPLTGTITPGVYCYSSAAALSGPVVLDAQGDPAAEFVFRAGSTLNVPAGDSVSVINGASPCNVYWVVGTSATLQAGTSFVGNILAQESITAVTGASISGRALARNAAVTLDTNAVNAPLSCEAPAPLPVSTRTLTFTATVDKPGTYCNEAQIVSFSDGTNVTIPIDLNGQACFTALQSDLAIVKDFVAADGTTSLGKALTVEKNAPARLRVRVINSGTGTATAVVVTDALTSGTLANYSITVPPPNSTANDATRGFATAAADLAGNTTRELFFTVAASADGKYCDTATVTATSGCTVAANCSDSACLTVATPLLTIKKTDDPASVLPGGSYTSTIVVTNTGTATAKNVVISDVLGLNSTANVRAIYVSSSLNGAAGTLTNNKVSTSAVDIPAGQSVTFTVVSGIPLGAVAGTYCDTASAASSNAASPTPDEECVVVPAFSALQTQLVDLSDPVRVGSDVTYFSVLYVEALSNQGVSGNELTYSFGLANPTDIGKAGLFDVTSTKVYLDSNPVRDPVTGLVVSDTSSATAVLQTLGTDYTLSAPQRGFQKITMTPTVVLQPNTALYVVNVVNVPSGTAVNKVYTTSYIWDSVGLIGGSFRASSSEPTTVIQ